MSYFFGFYNNYHVAGWEFRVKNLYYEINLDTHLMHFFAGEVLGVQCGPLHCDI